MRRATRPRGEVAGISTLSTVCSSERESVTSTSALKDPGTDLVTTSDRMALFIQAAGCIGGRRYSMRVPPQTLTTVFFFNFAL